MDPKFQTSFIPKKPLADTPSSISGAGFFLIISIIIFVIAIAASAGVYFYGTYLQKQNEESKQKLLDKEAHFDTSSIERLVALNSRIKAAEDLLDKHIVLTSLFEFFQESVLKTVRFESLAYTYSPQKISISMKGQANSYNSIAFQSDVLNGKKFIKNALFSNLNLDASGNVGFNFVAEVDPTLLSYKYLLSKNEPETATVSEETQ